MPLLLQQQVARRLSQIQIRYLENAWTGESLNSFGIDMLEYSPVGGWRRTDFGNAVLAEVRKAAQ